MRFINLISLLFLSHTALSQIEVHQEPMHQTVLENKIGRVLDVITQPGDTSLMHRHSSNYCYVTISGGKIWNNVKNSGAKNFNLYTGFIGGYYENPEKPYNHQFANNDSSTIRLIAVENFSLHGNPSDSSYQARTSEAILVNNPFFVITKMLIQSREEVDIQTKYPSVVICLNSTPIQIKNGKKMKPIPKWAWLDPYQKYRLFNSYNELATLILVQLKNEKHSNK